MTLSTAGLMLALVLFAGQAPVTPPPLPADQQQRLAKLPGVAIPYADARRLRVLLRDSRVNIGSTRP